MRLCWYPTQRTISPAVWNLPGGYITVPATTVWSMFHVSGAGTLTAHGGRSESTEDGWRMEMMEGRPWPIAVPPQWPLPRLTSLQPLPGSHQGLVWASAATTNRLPYILRGVPFNCPALHTGRLRILKTPRVGKMGQFRVSRRPQRKRCTALLLLGKNLDLDWMHDACSRPD